MAINDYKNLRTADDWKAYFKTKIPELNQNWTNTSDDDLGIVLVNFFAMLGDELNFRVDMAFLEAFLSTTRERSNAQALLNLIGYTMGTYRTCTTKITVKYPPSEVYDTPLTIPRFTAFGPVNGTIRYYTLVDQILPSYTNEITFDVFEGQYYRENHLSSEIDDNGRLYLTAIANKEIAENAVAVQYDSNIKLDYVNNILLSTDKYKFQLLIDYNGRNYIQFDSNWRQYIDRTASKSINVDYLVTSLSKGAVGAHTLTRMILPDGIILTHTITTDNIIESTPSSQPETVENARKNAPRYARTMGTAVTLKDYEDLILINFSEVADIKAVDLNYDTDLEPYQLRLVVMPSVIERDIAGTSVAVSEDLENKIRAQLDNVRLATITYSVEGPKIIDVDMTLYVGSYDAVTTNAALAGKIQSLVTSYMDMLKIGEKFSMSKLMGYLHNHPDLANIAYITQSLGSMTQLIDTPLLEVVKAGTINVDITNIGGAV